MFRFTATHLRTTGTYVAPPVSRLGVVLPFPYAPPTLDPVPVVKTSRESRRAKQIRRLLEMPFDDTREYLIRGGYLFADRVLHRFIRDILGFHGGMGEYMNRAIRRMRERNPRMYRMKDAEVKKLARQELADRIHEECLQKDTSL